MIGCHHDDEQPEYRVGHGQPAPAAPRHRDDGDQRPPDVRRESRGPALTSQLTPLRLSPEGSGSACGSDTLPVTSAASRTRSPSTSRTSVPGSTRSSLTKVPLVEPSSVIVACPASSTWTVACRRDTLSKRAKAAATSDSAG